MIRIMRSLSYCKHLRVSLVEWLGCRYVVLVARDRLLVGSSLTVLLGRRGGTRGRGASTGGPSTSTNRSYPSKQPYAHPGERKKYVLFGQLFVSCYVVSRTGSNPSQAIEIILRRASSTTELINGHRLAAIAMLLSPRGEKDSTSLHWVIFVRQNRPLRR